MNSFTTTDLVSAAILLAAGEPVSVRTATGGLCAFVFECSPEQAQALLGAREADAGRAYHRALVVLRRHITALGGRR